MTKSVWKLVQVCAAALFASAASAAAASVASIGCTHHTSPATPRTAAVEPRLAPAPVAIEPHFDIPSTRRLWAPAAVAPRVSSSCEGDAEADGQRCVTIVRGSETLGCQFEISRAGVDENGHEGSDTETTTLTIAADGSFRYRYESRGERRWSDGSGRTIETQGMLESEYREDATGAGRCPGSSGDMVACEREDVLPRLGADPCTSRFLG